MHVQNNLTQMSNLKWFTSWILTLHPQQAARQKWIPYIADWQCVYGTPINSHFLTCADHHDLPPSVIVWASTLSALHLLISEAFCSEKGNCQQQNFKRMRKQKEAGSEMCNFHLARLMGEERRRQRGERKKGEEKRPGRGGINLSNKGTLLSIDFPPNYCLICILPFLDALLILPHPRYSSLNWHKS